MENKSKEESLLLDHNYDGIQEFDYPLPTWWVITFWGGIIFAVIYFCLTLVGGITPLQQEYAISLKEQRAIQAAYLEKLENFDESKFNTYFKDENMIHYGNEVFINNCMSCHNINGAGDIGPNLSDNSWLYAEGTPETIYTFILSGNPSGGMPSWADKLSEDDLYSLTGYIMTLQGVEHTIPVKEAQGDEFPVWSLEE